MAKSEPATPETSLGQAGLPPSYGGGIREGSYGNGRNYVGNSSGGIGFGGPGQPGPMSGAGPSNDMMNTIMRVIMGMSGGSTFGRNTDIFGGQNGMGGPRGTGYNFGTPISGAGYFSGLPGATGGSQAGQRLVDPYANTNTGGSFFDNNPKRPQQPVDNSRPTPRG